MLKYMSYKEQDDLYCNKKTKCALSEMPYFITEYSYDLNNDVTPRTKMAYIYDIRRFMHWLCDINPLLCNKSIKEVSLQDINSLTLNDINEYKTFLETDKKYPNKANSKARKISSLNSLFDFLYRSRYIQENPLSRQRSKHRNLPKVPIIKLQPDEVASILDNIENGTFNTSKRQRSFLEKTKIRDLAIMTTLLGTGIRVSECVGLNIEDVNFKEASLLLNRKGSKKQVIPMSDEVYSSLNEYMQLRKMSYTQNQNEHALFLSSQNKRLCVRAVENLVKKYSQMSNITKNISPHKLRKTFGTELYNQTGDIYLVAKILGHNSVNTTKNHYILDDDMALFQKRNAVKLRR